jgi:hypothetical protein
MRGRDVLDTVIAAIAVARYMRERDSFAPPTETQRTEGLVHT